MNILDRYIFSQFTRNLLMVAGALLTIYLLVDFFEKIDNFIDAGKTTGLAGRYLLLKIPLIIDQLLPVCLLLAGVITLGVMNQNHEFMALEAGGLSIRRILLPILAATFFFTILALLAGEWIVPATVKETNRIWYEEVKRTKSQGIVRHGYVFYKGKEGIYSFRRAAKKDDVFTNFNYSVLDPAYNLKSQISAASASWREGTWFFRDVMVKTLGTAAGTYGIKHSPALEMALPDRPEDFFIPEYKTQETTISDHLREILDNSAPGRAAWQNLHRKISYIFLGIPLVLLGLPVLMIAHRRWHQDLALAVPLSCIMAFLAWGWWSAAQSMTSVYNLNPLAASWSIHLLTGFTGLLMIRRQNNQPR